MINPPKRERDDDIRLMQHVFNVLMFNGVLDFVMEPGGKTYYIVQGIDPFNIEDPEYREMEAKYEQFTKKRPTV